MSPAEPPDPPQLEPFATESSERIYDSVWCGLRRDQVRLDDGTLQEHHVFEVGGAVAIVPVLEDGSILLLWQYRHPLGHAHWEIPAGRMHTDETPEEAGRRELLEETGYRAARMQYIQGFYPINGISPHHAHVFLAYGCTASSEGTAHDPTERMSVHVFPADEVRRKLVAGEIEDGFALIALFHHFARNA